MCCDGLQAFNFATALNPFGPTFDDDNQQDVKKRPRGPTQKAMDPVSNPQGYLGISKGFGFTKKNELFVGRVAMLVCFVTFSGLSCGPQALLHAKAGVLRHIVCPST